MSLDGLDRSQFLKYLQNNVFLSHHFGASKVLMKGQNLDDGLTEKPLMNKDCENITENNLFT